MAPLTFTEAERLLPPSARSAAPSLKIGDDGRVGEPAAPVDAGRFAPSL